jgi:hypothetical protein
MIDMRYTGRQGWAYAYNFSPAFYFRYIYRGTWVPSAIPNDYDVLGIKGTPPESNDLVIVCITQNCRNRYAVRAPRKLACSSR